jgi:hypothetical protein
VAGAVRATLLAQGWCMHLMHSALARGQIATLKLRADVVGMCNYILSHSKSNVHKGNARRC